jgi:hypothetical protein
MIPSTRRANGFWNDIQNQRKFLFDVEKKLGIKSKEGWYSIKAKQVLKLGGHSLLAYLENIQNNIDIIDCVD